MPTFKEIYQKRFGQRRPTNSKLKHTQENSLDEFITKLETLGDEEILDQFQVLLWRTILYLQRSDHFAEAIQKIPARIYLMIANGDEEKLKELLTAIDKNYEEEEKEDEKWDAEFQELVREARLDESSS